MAPTKFRDLIPELVTLGVKVVDALDDKIDGFLDPEPEKDKDGPYYIHAYDLVDGTWVSAFSLGPLTTPNDAVVVQNFLAVNKVKGKPAVRWVTSQNELPSPTANL